MSETEALYGDHGSAVTEKRDLIDEKTIKDFLFGSDTKLTEQQQLLFLRTAKAFNLNPFKREIYAIPRKQKRDDGSYEDKLSILTGYEVYLKRAEDTEKLDGWKVDMLFSSGGLPTGAKITIYRKDWKYPFEHTVNYEEYNQKNYIWNTKGKTMIKKVVMAQGFRLCFPNDLGGMPYLAEELPDDKPPVKEETIRPELTADQKRFKDENSVPPPPEVHLTGCISAAQAKRLYAIAMSSGRTKEQLKELLQQYNFKSSLDVPWQLYNEICEKAAIKIVTGPAEAQQLDNDFPCF